MMYNPNWKPDLSQNTKLEAERRARAWKSEFETADKTIKIFDYISAQLSARPGTHDPREISFIASKLTIATRLTQIREIIIEGIDVNTN